MAQSGGIEPVAAEPAEETSCSSRPDSLSLKTRGWITRSGSGGSSNSSSGSSITSTSSQDCRNRDTPDSASPGQRSDEPEPEALQEEMAGLLLEQFANQDDTYTGLEVLSPVKGCDTIFPVTSPPSTGPDEKPVLKGMTPTPDEVALSAFFGSDWRARMPCEKDGTVTSKFKALKRDGSSVGMPKSETQLWSLRINNNKLYLFRNGRKYDQVAGVCVDQDRDKLVYSSGTVNPKPSYFYHGPTIVTIDSEPEGATAPAFTPDHSGTDNPDAQITSFSINPLKGGAPPPPTLQYSSFLFSKKAYLVLDNYPTDPTVDPETATLKGFTEAELIQKLELRERSRISPAQAAFTPLISVRVSPDTSQTFCIALFFDTTYYRYYVYVKDHELILKPVRLNDLKKDDWRYHVQFTGRYHNTGHDTPDMGASICAPLADLPPPKPTTDGSNGHAEHFGHTPPVIPPPPRQRVAGTPESLGEVPDWPPEHYGTIVKEENAHGNEVEHQAH